MKSPRNTHRSSSFWSRLLGTLIAFAIVALLVYGGVSNLMGELSDVYDALAASQAEAADAKARLDSKQAALAQSQAELDMAHQAIERQDRKLRRGGQALAGANAAVEALMVERDDLKRGLREAAQALARSDQMYKAAIAGYRDAKAELERIEQQPKLSVVMTTERQFAMSQRETFAASRTRMFAEGDAGRMYYDGAKVFHEKEQHVRYSERSQIVLTQTGPGDDALRCLRDGCALILAAQQSAMQMQRYAYQSQYLSSEMLLADGRRGRRR